MARFMSYLYLSEENKIALNFETYVVLEERMQNIQIYNVRGHNAITTWKK